MKKITVITAVLIAFVFVFSVPAAAASFKSASNQFVFDQEAYFNGQISGDLIIFGRNVSAAGAVLGDVIAAGENVSVGAGGVKNIFAAGNMVEILAQGAKNIYAAGNFIKIDKDSILNGAYIAGRSVSFNGLAANLYINAETISIDGAVSESAVICGENITISQTAKINKIDIYSINEPQIPDSVNRENVNFHKIEKNNGVGRAGANAAAFMGGALSVFSAIALAGTMLAAVVLTLLNSQYFKVVAGEFKQKVGWSLLYGLVALIVIPIASFLLMILVITVPICIIVFMLYCIALYISPAYTAVVLGRLFFKNLNRYFAALIGAAAVGVVLWIPFLNIAGFLFCALYTLGSIVSNIKLGKKEINYPAPALNDGGFDNKNMGYKDEGNTKDSSDGF